MGEIKTKVTDDSVDDFLNKIADTQKRSDAYTLLQIYLKNTKEQAKMWGTSMIGFGKYHYKSERSSQEGDWPLSAFSPRKQNLTLYFMTGFDNLQPYLAKLGKHKISVGCLYIKRLSDIDLDVLENLIKFSYLEAKRKLEK